ncbi:hypothetical protein TD95_004702, partial [Thielaviopsis punctulata]
MDYGMTASIRTLWQTRASAGEATGSVKVTNLNSVVQAGHDAWGRSNKPQPVVISVDVALAHPFVLSRQTDDVAADTVHYGLLCKAVLGTLNHMNLRQVGSISNPHAGDVPPITLRGVLDRVWVALTGVSVSGLKALPSGEPVRQEDEDEEGAVNYDGSGVNNGRPFLDLNQIHALTVCIMFPKASLLGSGVSLTAMAVFREDAGSYLRQWRVGGSSSVVKTYGVALKIHDMRVPTLIGLNDNERLAKQVVVTDIQIDKYDEKEDTYTTLEALVQKAMIESSYGTLEALASKICSLVKMRFLPEKAHFYEGTAGWQVKLKLTKPTAVPMAEGASI